MNFKNEKDLINHLAKFNDMEYDSKKAYKIEKILYKLGYKYVGLANAMVGTFIGKYIKIDYNNKEAEICVLGKGHGNLGIFGYEKKEYITEVENEEEANKLKERIEFLNACYDDYVEMNDTPNYWTIKKRNEEIEKEIAELNKKLGLY